MKDYSVYNKNQKEYTGSEEKFGITIDNKDYIVKFQKNSETGLLNNHISEHLGSNIFKILGEEAQSTFLGLYNDREVVICEDFIESGEIYLPLNGIVEVGFENNKELYQYSYEDIIIMLKENIKITNVSETIEKFWNMYIIDALIGNFDRHGANWGFLKKDNAYRMAPIFDNGSSLFPRRNTEELMKEVLENETIMMDMTYKYPTSQIRLQNKKSSYYDVISSMAFHECNQALKRIYQRMNINEIFAFFESQEDLSEIQKTFYRYIIEYRYKHIIEKSYKLLVGEANE